MADHDRTKTVQVNMRMTPDLARRIDSLADDEGRSRANWAERALLLAVERAEGKTKNRPRTIDRKVARG